MVPGRNDPQLGDFLRKQAVAVGQQDVQVSVLFVHPVEGLATATEQEVSATDGIWELRCYYRAFTGPFKRVVNFFRYRKAAFLGWAKVLSERGRPDLIHAHILIRAVWLARRIADQLGVPYVVSEQSSEYIDGSFAAKPAWVKRFARRQVRDAAETIAVSSFLGDALVKHGLYSTYTVVPNVLPVEQVPLPPAGPKDEFMMVADLVDRTKNVSGVLRALSLAREQGVSLRLKVIGDGEDRKNLEALSRELDLTEQVVFLGRLPNAAVLEHMARTGTVVINSNVETFSVVTGEALTLGRPVVATRCGGPTAFLSDDNGMLVDPGDDTGLAHALIQVYRDHARYSPEAIRQGVSERYSATAVGKLLGSIYTRILEDARS